MTKVKFNLEKPNGKDETLIRLVYRYNDKKLVYTTKFKVQPKHWNEKKQEVKKSFKDHKAINDFLEHLERLTISTYSKLIIENPKLNNDQFRKALNLSLERSVVKVEKQITFLAFFDQFINDNPNNVTKDTLKGFRSIYEILLSYQKNRKMKTFDFVDFTFDWYDDFKLYCLSERKLSDNYFGIAVKKTKQILQEGYRRRLHTNLEFKDFKGVDKPVDKIYLNEMELKQLFDYDFSDNKTYERTRDLFLIGCYTGLRHSDFSDIQPDNIRTEINQDTGEAIQIIEIYTKKTKEFFYYEVIHPIAKAILKRYEGKAPEGMTGQRMNVYLKELCKVAKIDNIEVETTHRAGERIEIKKPKHEFISTHTARRSFVSNGLASGIDSQMLRAATGHKTDKAFTRYNRLSTKEQMKNFSKTDFMTGKNINFDDVI